MVDASNTSIARRRAMGDDAINKVTNNSATCNSSHWQRCCQLLFMLWLCGSCTLGQAQLKVEPAAAALPLELHMDNTSFEQLVEAKLNESNRHAQDLLSRKRRYLLFPEGSSFQMVFDEIVGVVDHTNYLILGITVALAWELPSKPPSEILEDLRTKLNDGNLDISRNDTAENITYVDSTETPSAVGHVPNYINMNTNAAQSTGSNAYYAMTPVFRTPMHPVHQYRDSYYKHAAMPPGWRRKDGHYYSNYGQPASSSSRNPFQKWTKPFTYAAPQQKSRYPYWALATHFKNALQSRNGYYNRSAAQRRQGYTIEADAAATTATPAPAPPPPPRHHHIYPVFGKRSIPDAANPHRRQRRSGVQSQHEAALTKLERIQIKHHRQSRQLLYERIEKYLDKRGHHGRHCVLRALCETGQKGHEREPGTFVGELMRAIFTIPETVDNEPVAYQDTHYDKAHAHAGDCAALYPECKQSMWQADFIQ